MIKVVLKGEKPLRGAANAHLMPVKFKSEKEKNEWAYPLTGSEYKAKRDEPGDKVMYHFSQHCHGCKKFGGKYEEFARNK